MSDDSKDIPAKKLRLSRDSASQQASENATEPAAVDPTPPSVNELEQLIDLNDSQPEAESAKKPLLPSEPPPSKLETESAFDPKNPFGKSLKENEIGAAQPDADELPSKSAPQSNDKSDVKVEDAVNSLNSQSTQAAADNSLLPSIIILLVLVLILCGAGYGLWFVLQTPDGTASSAEETSPPAQASNSLIERAKATINEVYVADTDAITDSSSPIQRSSETSAAPTTTPILPHETAKAPIETHSLPTKTVKAPTDAPKAPIRKAVAPPVDQAKSALVEANKASVSAYLATIHIGGVRQGVRPAVMIEGETFLVGDVIQAETGLKFDGIRDGRLAFRDTHEIVYLKSF